MTRLDHNRAITQLAPEDRQPVTAIRRMTIWGNHSSTQYPDISQTTIAGSAAKGVIDNGWYQQEFIPQVQQRGAAVIKARGSSSAASAANAALNHMRTGRSAPPPMTGSAWASTATAAMASPKD
jgi:malate dehydrogenase